MFTSAKHPERGKEFKASAPPKNVIKQGRKEAIMACTNCGIPNDEDVALKRCEVCQVSWYCSRDCQKADWPRHKQHCDPSLSGGIQPLVTSVTGNPMISHYLQICICYEFGLHKLDRLSPADKRTVLRSPLFVNVDVGIEPTRITDFMNLYTLKELWDKDNLEGMFQFHHFASIRSGVPKESAFSDYNMAMWKHAREDTDEEGEENTPVVLVRFVNNMKQSITCIITVDDDALESAKEAEPFTRGSALTGEKTVHPMSIDSCLEYLNTHIRCDTNNRLFLRAPMREVDKELIRDAGRNKNTHAPQALRVKMKREHVYVSHRVEVEVSPDGGKDRVVAAKPVDREEVDRINARVVEQLRMRREEQERPDPRMPAMPQQVNPPKNRTERRQLEREMKKAQKKAGNGK